jgi:exodeoxyribonuclease VII large subunit
MTFTFGESTLDDLEHDELPDDVEPEELIPVEKLTKNLRGLFKGFDKFDNEFIVGEISNRSESNSGNLYFTIEAAYTDSALKCVVWEGNRGQLDLDLSKEMLVAVSGELKFYEGGGHPSLYVDEISLVGESAYWRRIEQLKSQLKSEGLFADERKDDLPTLPGRVGVATATNSDAEQDIVDSIHTRYPDVDIVVHDTAVQGDNAPDDITEAVRALDRPDIDVIIVSRGGGSDSDLRAFNEEPVVRAVAEAETPTVSAVGHEADEPLVDQVADARAKTPTAAGATVVPEKEGFTEQAQDAREGVQAGYQTQVLRWQGDHRERIGNEYARLASQWFELTASDVDQGYSELAGNWLATTRPAIERSASTHIDSWMQAHEQAIRSNHRQFTDTWFTQQRSTIEQLYSETATTWIATTRPAINQATTAQTDSWMQTQEQTIQTEYRQIANQWIAEQRTEIEQAVDKLEQQEEFEEQTEGLRKQRAVLIALVVLFGLGFLLLLLTQFVL